MRRKGALGLRLLAALTLGAVAVLGAAALAGAEHGPEQAAVIDIAVTNAATPDPVQVNTQLAYAITVLNRGPDPATNVLLTDAFPVTAALLEMTASQGSCAASPILTCALGTIGPDQVVSVTALVRPSATGKLENTATAIGAEPDANVSDNSATATTVVYSLTRPPTAPRPPTKPPAGGPACVLFRVSPPSIHAGYHTAVQVTVSERRKRLEGVRVNARGAGAHTIAFTGKTGVASLGLRPSRTGVIAISLPGRNTCGGSRRIGVVSPVFRPPVTG
jgi:uncharacterized repeat protein (TIGR01451 family)